MIAGTSETAATPVGVRDSARTVVTDLRAKSKVSVMAKTYSLIVCAGLVGSALWFSRPTQKAATPFSAEPVSHQTNEPPKIGIAPPAPPRSCRDDIEDLVRMPEEELAKLDIAEVNLRCACGLPGAEGIDIEKMRQTLDQWAAFIQHETDRHMYQFHRDPADFRNSEGYFRILVMITALQRDLKVHYNPQRINDPYGRDSRDLFIHGLVNGHGGTCASMPALYVAIGRRLGYPLKLVGAQAHLFARWDDPQTGERFNIEGSYGFADHSDDYYREWPRPISDIDMATGRFRSFTPRAALAGFLGSRAACLEANDREAEAGQVRQWERELELPFWASHPGVRANADGTLHLINYGVDIQIIPESMHRMP